MYQKIIIYCIFGGDMKFAAGRAGLRWNPRVYSLITRPGSEVLSPCSSLPSSSGFQDGVQDQDQDQDQDQVQKRPSLRQRMRMMWVMGLQCMSLANIPGLGQKALQKSFTIYALLALNPQVCQDWVKLILEILVIKYHQRWRQHSYKLPTLLSLLTLLTLPCMNTLFYFDCLGHQELKNRAHTWIWQLFAVIWDRTDGTGRIMLLRLLQMRC